MNETNRSNCYHNKCGIFVLPPKRSCVVLSPQHHRATSNLTKHRARGLGGDISHPSPETLQPRTLDWKEPPVPLVCTGSYAGFASQLSYAHSGPLLAWRCGRRRGSRWNSIQESKGQTGKLGWEVIPQDGP